MPKKRDKARFFLHRTWKGWLLQAWGPFIVQHPPTSTIQNVWQTSLQFNKCVTAEEESRGGKKNCQTEKRTMCLSTILTVAEAAQKTSKNKLERAGRTEEDVHLSYGQGRMIDGLCRPIGLHTFSLGRFSVNGGFALSGGVAWACLITVSPL